MNGHFPPRRLRRPCVCGTSIGNQCHFQWVFLLGRSLGSRNMREPPNQTPIGAKWNFIKYIYVPPKWESSGYLGIVTSVWIWWVGGSIKLDRVSVSVVSTTAHALALSYDILRKLEAAMKNKWKLREKEITILFFKIGLKWAKIWHYCNVHVSGTYL